jgi:hypothetical protein
MQIDIIIKDIYYIQLHTLKTFTQHCVNVFDKYLHYFHVSVKSLDV